MTLQAEIQKRQQAVSDLKRQVEQITALAGDDKKAGSRVCDKPPGLDGTPSFCKAHVNLQLVKSRSATGRDLLHRLWWGLKETGAKLGNGRKVFNRNDAVV